MEGEWRYEVILIKAEADGVGPSLLVSVSGKGKGPQYLFNVPEGFSRLVLEHKLRPSACLASVFLTSLRPHCAGGLGGLLLRLADDGHGQFQLIGPDCSSMFLHSLRHILYWRHPKVFVSDCQSSRPLPIFDDDFVTIHPIVLNDKLPVCPWCEHGKHGLEESEVHAKHVACADSRNKFEDKPFCTTFSTSSEDLDDSISSSYEGSESQDLDKDCFEIIHHEKKGPGRHLICKGSKILKDPEIVKGKKMQVDGNHRRSCKTQRKEFGSINSRQGSNWNSGNLSASDIEEIYEDGEGCSEAGIAMAQADELFDKKGFKRGSSASSKRKRHPTMNGLKKGPIFDLKAVNNLGSEVLQDLTCPYISDGNCCSVSKSGLVQKQGALQGMKTTSNSYALEPCCSNGLHGRKNEATDAGRKFMVPGEDMLDILKGSDRSPVGTVTMEQDVHEDNIRITPSKVEDRQTTNISTYEGRETECQWRINNKLEIELPDLPDGTIPLYIKHPGGSVTLIEEELVKQTQLSIDRCEEYQMLSKASEILGFVCYMKKLRSVMVVVSCETPELIDQLYEHSLLRYIFSPNSYGKGKNCHHPISGVIHLSPPCVLKSKKYISWMNQLGDGILQITMHGGPAEFGFHSSFSTLAKLNMVNEEIFPLPFNVLSHGQQIWNQNFENFGLSKQVKTSRLLMRIVFQGKLGKEVQVVMDDSMCQDNTNVDLIQKAFTQSKPNIAESLDEATKDISEALQNAGVQMSPNKLSALVLREKLIMQRKSMVKDSTTQDVCTISSSISVGNNSNCSDIDNIHYTCCNGKAKPAEFKVRFLGTGCAEPSRHRGSSGILVQVHQSRASILLDAGEGVAGQILRAFGQDEMGNVIRTLQCVWISHKHADHVLGTVSIIAARTENAPVLLVVGSTAVREWLLEVHLIYRRLGYPLPRFTFVHCKEFVGHQHGSSWYKKLSHDDPVSRMLESLQLHSMRCVWVDHCSQACGLVLSSMSGWSIVYSGDTRPCGRLIQAGMGCTLLIHEATFADKFESHARAKQHSTISEALQVGREMGAQHVILTHFSQRSPKVMAIDISKHQSASLAFDGMVLWSRHLFALPKLMHCLVSLFAEDESNVQDKDLLDADDLVNQAKQFPRSSTKGPSNLPKVECVMRSIEKGDDMGYFVMKETQGGETKAISCVEILSAKQYCLPKHIRWEDSESEDD